MDDLGGGEDGGNRLEMGNVRDSYDGRRTFGFKYTIREGWFERMWKWLINKLGG